MILSLEEMSSLDELEGGAITGCVKPNEVLDFAAGMGNPGHPDRLGNERLKSVTESGSCCLILYG